MDTLPRYARWTRTFDASARIDRVVFRTPGGEAIERPTYAHQPARLVYDRHGYETIEPAGEGVTAVRFTPTQTGRYAWEAMAGGAVVARGELECTPSDHPGYVERSGRDPRYFAFTSGQSYCPIGVNLCWPVYYPLPRGREEFATSGERGTMGVKDYERWFAAMASAGGNYTRIWLSSPALTTDTDVAGEQDPARFARIDAIVELARRHGIRLKMCIEHWRYLDNGSEYHATRTSHPAFCRTLTDAAGRHPAGEDEWLSEEHWRTLWLRKVQAYLARYGDDPVVFAWELWNEIECIHTSRFDFQRDWTRDMLAAIKARSPRNLVTNSLGSFDYEPKIRIQQDFHMEEMDFQQVHRYLDQGAAWEICNTDPVALSLDAVARTRRPDRPILLTETGAVNDSHTGAFRYYRTDRRGLLLHDITVAPLFAGSAGSGHTWFWEDYVEPLDVWRHLTPLAKLIEGIALDGEGFQPLDLSTDTAWVLALVGREHTLVWVRNRRDRWDHVLRDGIEPAVVEDLALDLSPGGVTDGEARLVPCWVEDTPPASTAGTLPIRQGRLTLPPFRYGLMLRIGDR